MHSGKIAVVERQCLQRCPVPAKLIVSSRAQGSLQVGMMCGEKFRSDGSLRYYYSHMCEEKEARVRE